jgi:hypothetical protein
VAKKVTSKSKEYWRAFERVKRIKPIPGIDASKRMTREEANTRQRQPRDPFETTLPTAP